MKNMRIGVHIALQNIQMMSAPSLIDGIVAADRDGLDTAWLTVGGPAPDPFAVFVGAALSGAERITFWHLDRADLSAPPDLDGPGRGLGRPDRAGPHDPRPRPVAQAGD